MDGKLINQHITATVCAKPCHFQFINIGMKELAFSHDNKMASTLYKYMQWQVGFFQTGSVLCIYSVCRPFRQQVNSVALRRHTADVLSNIAI